MKILITGIGGPTPRSIARTIRISHPDATIVGIDANQKSIGFFMPGLLDSYYLVPRVDKKEYWDIIHTLIEAENVDLAFVQPETEVIAWGEYFNTHGSYPCPVLIPPHKLASVLVDKGVMSCMLKDTDFIPKTNTVNPCEIDLPLIAREIGYPCWMRATRGSGGYGSMLLANDEELASWLKINKKISEFTVSEFLPGRHLATQMLYLEGQFIKGASLECVEYVMSSISPSGITGNTSFGRLINEDAILEFCDRCIRYLSEKIGILPHGVLSFDLKEDIAGKLKVTEVNIRHMAYTGVMASAGFNLVSDSVTFLKEHDISVISKEPFFHFTKPYVFLRDVDTGPLLLEGESVFPELR